MRNYLIATQFIEKSISIKNRTLSNTYFSVYLLKLKSKHSTQSLLQSTKVVNTSLSKFKNIDAKIKSCVI